MKKLRVREIKQLTQGYRSLRSRARTGTCLTPELCAVRHIGPRVGPWPGWALAGPLSTNTAEWLCPQLPVGLTISSGFKPCLSRSSACTPLTTPPPQAPPLRGRRGDPAVPRGQHQAISETRDPVRTEAGAQDSQLPFADLEAQWGPWSGTREQEGSWLAGAEARGHVV